MRHQIQTIAALLAIAVAATAQDAQRQESKRTVAFDPKRGELTIQAEQQSLAAILDELARKHGLRVRPVGLEDRQVSIDLQQKPLHEALRQLLGRDARYLLDSDNDAIVPPPADGAQPVDGAVVVDAARKRMDDPLPVRSGAVMPAVERIGATAVQSAGPVMAPVGQIVAVPMPVVPAGSGVGETPPPAHDVDGTHACVRLRLRADGTAVVDAIKQLDGVAFDNGMLHGDVLYAVKLDGAVVAVGSMQDPLLARCVCEEKPRDPRIKQTRNTETEGMVVLQLDERFLDAATLARTTIEFHRLTDGKDLPERLTVATFEGFLPKCRPLATVAAQTLVRTPIEKK